MSQEVRKKLFDTVDAFGECLDGSVHVIKIESHRPADEREGEYRIYHEDGYCVDFKKEYICEPDDIGDFDSQSVHTDGFNYETFAEWEGFEKIKDNNHLLNLLKKWLKK